MMGHDPHCERWIARFREAAPSGVVAEIGRGRRERGRRPRA
jgi:5-methyltetrahydrofolate--homocysteine methyltransferase